MKYLLLFLLSVNICLGDEAVFVEKGKPMPFDGYAITEEKANKIREVKIDLDTCTHTKTLLTDDNTLFKQRLESYKQHTDELSKRLVEERDNTLINKVGYFLLGAAVTTAIAYGATRAVR